MVDSKGLDQFSIDERQGFLKDIVSIFEKNGLDKLEAPKLFDQLIADLTKAKFERKFHLQVEGRVKADQKEQSEKAIAEINELLKDVAKGDKEVAITAKIGVGDQMAPIENANDVNTEKKVTIEHKQGQVILYDLWATWCPPCQRPMAHNQEMLTSKKATWGDKVRIVGLSIDSAVPVVKAHVEKNKWAAIEHYHVRNGECTASETYGSGGVPHVWLVDTQGKIVFMGHPATRKLEEDIDNLLAGNAITGEGTGAAAEEKGEVSKGKEDVAAALTKFEEAAKTFVVAAETKKAVEDGVSRGFVVVVDTVSYKNGDYTHDAVCHTQVVGKQDAINNLKKLCDTINQGPWENKDMVRTG